MNLKNFTPHDVNIVRGDETLTIPSACGIDRPGCSETREVVQKIQVDGLDVPVNRTVLGEVEGLPEPEEGTLYIVSRVVAEAASGRDDLIIPDDTIRDEAGRIVGCRAFARV